jgi:RNA polymerase sigma-70 factor (ECF subfamily)
VTEVDELVHRCQSGDAKAFRQLFEAHRRDVARLVFRMLGASPDLEDVVQEVFMQVHRSIGDFRGSARFSTWLYRVAVNVVLMHRRAARSRPRLDQGLAEQELLDHEPLPDDRAAQRSRVRAFYRLLERLSEKKRTVYVLHELEGMAPADIGRIVKAPVLTVRTRLFYARRELAQMLVDEPVLAGLASDETVLRPTARPGRVDPGELRRKEPAA